MKIFKYLVNTPVLITVGDMSKMLFDFFFFIFKKEKKEKKEKKPIADHHLHLQR